MSQPYIHPTAIVEEGAVLHEDVKIWHFCHIRKGAVLERGVSLGRDVYVDVNVRIGEYSRIQNGVSIYQGVMIDPWCFVGPHVIFTNDQYPRAGNKNWSVAKTFLKFGSSVGAGAVIRCGVELGEFSMIGSGAIVTKSVPPFFLALGFPAKYEKKICFCGKTKKGKTTKPQKLLLDCCKQNLSDRMIVAIHKYFKLSP